MRIETDSRILAVRSTPNCPSGFMLGQPDRGFQGTSDQKHAGWPVPCWRLNRACGGSIVIGICLSFGLQPIERSAHPDGIAPDRLTQEVNGFSMDHVTIVHPLGNLN